jgi:hypothetical protein
MVTVSSPWPLNIEVELLPNGDDGRSESTHRGEPRIQDMPFRYGSDVPLVLLEPSADSQMVACPQIRGSLGWGELSCRSKSFVQGLGFRIADAKCLLDRDAERRGTSAEVALCWIQPNHRFLVASQLLERLLVLEPWHRLLSTHETFS